MKVIRFEPIYKERVWGGQDLKGVLGRDIPDGHIGESWEIVDRPEANSRICAGAWKGLTLREALEAHGDEIMGPGWSPRKPFPILVKWLDCQERLSLQVHPPAEVADELGGEPKTENWYIAGAKPGARLLAGLRKGVTRAEFEKALANNTLEPLVHALPSRKGDSLFVHSGRIHAIDAGNLILEIQQNSDTTYRVYDWGRVGLDGNPREMHIEESLRCIDFEDFEPPMLRGSGSEDLLADCGEFRLRRIRLDDAASFRVDRGQQPRILSVVEGGLREAVGDEVCAGENVLLPYNEGFDFVSVEPTVILITDQFTGLG